MNKAEIVYVTYIAAADHGVWDELTQPELTRHVRIFATELMLLPGTRAKTLTRYH